LIAVLVPKKAPGTTSHEFSLPRRTPGILRVFVFCAEVLSQNTWGVQWISYDWLVVFRPTPLKNDGVRQLR